MERQQQDQRVGELVAQHDQRIGELVAQLETQSQSHLEQTQLLQSQAPVLESSDPPSVDNNEIYQQQITSLQTRVSELEQEVESYKSTISQLEEEREQLQYDLEEYKSRVVMLEGLLEGETERYGELEGLVEGEKEKSAELERLLEGKKKKSGEVQGRLEVLVEEKKSVAEERERDVWRLNEEINLLKSQVRKLCNIFFCISQIYPWPNIDNILGDPSYNI
eukprot:sb/3469819/